MTKTEELLQDKMDKEDCKDKHAAIERFIKEQIASLEKLFIEKIKGMRWFNIVHLLGYISIVITLLAIYFKKP